MTLNDYLIVKMVDKEINAAFYCRIEPWIDWCMHVERAIVVLSIMDPTYNGYNMLDL